MKRIDASSQLNEESFWSIISKLADGDGSVDDQERRLSSEIAKLSEKQVFGFLYHYYRLSAMSRQGDLWLVPYIILGVCSDDCFDYFRDWLIARGRETFYKALDDPDSLCDIFDSIPEGDEPTFEGLGYPHLKVFKEKFKKDFYEEEEKYDYGDALDRPKIDFQWSEDDEESMKKICPKTFEKWWENDRF